MDGASQADENSPIPFDPDLSSEFADEFDLVIDRVCQYRNQAEEILSRRIQKVEQNAKDPISDERTRYLAALEVLRDLLEIEYQPQRRESTFVLSPPDPDRFADEPEKYKQVERQILKKEQRAQFEKSSVREFISEMEARGERNQGSIKRLIANGEALYRDLMQARHERREKTTNALRETLQPYVQVVEKGKTDPYTGMDLMDIWRYFRYTWLTPYNTVPGRNINYLIRDAARENHPVMGIASLASSMMNLSARDEYIGWTFKAVEKSWERNVETRKYEVQLPKEERSYEGETRIETERNKESDESLQQRRIKLAEWVRPVIERGIYDTLDRIRIDDLIKRYDFTEDEFTIPTDETLKKLRRIEGKARWVLKGKPTFDDDGTANRLDPSRYGLTPAEIQDNELEDTDPDDLETWEERSETALYVRKRVETLQSLLRAKRYLDTNADKDDLTFLADALDSKAGRRTLKQGLKQIKKRRVGAGMMNIQVCGAIPPYNEILGGKLVAMALTGPQIIRTYQKKYDGAVSKIASAMAGEPITKNNELALLDTTGLFAHGSAQYDRIQVPAPNGQIEFNEVGKTGGYGSIQFGPKTRQWLVQVTQSEEGMQMVKGRFGEGIAPRLRKIRRGLENLGLDGDLLKHHSPRVVYVADVAANAAEYLRGQSNTPDYYWSFDDVAEEQESIYEHWRYRWVSKRVHKEEPMERLKKFEPEDLLLGLQFDLEITHRQQAIDDYS